MRRHAIGSFARARSKRLCEMDAEIRESSFIAKSKLQYRNRRLTTYVQTGIVKDKADRVMIEFSAEHIRPKT